MAFLCSLLAMDVSFLRQEASKVVGHEETEAVMESRLLWMQEALVPRAMQKSLITQVGRQAMAFGISFHEGL